MKSKERETFASRLGFILVSAGCAVGLGNVWKFPYICGNNGGAFFIIIYLLCLVLLGFPILTCEFAIGRGSGMSVGGALKKLGPDNGRWHRFRWFAFAGNYLLMMFYTMVAGWMLYYMYLFIKGDISGLDTEGVGNKFNEMLASPQTMVIFTIIVVVLCIGICAMGLQNGVERVTKVMMLMLIVLMIVMAVNSVLQKGSSEGLKFYLVPSLERVKERGLGNVVFDAMTHAFFTLSVGIGSMEIFGSYLSKDRKLAGESINVMILDTFVALMAGIIIIPSCFAYGVEPTKGPSLLFVTLPNVFNNMTFGRLWGVLFFVFMSFAALSTVIAVFENIIAIAMDLFGWTRERSLGFNLVGIAIMSMPAVLGFNILSGVQIMGEDSTIMDVEDFLVSYNILPLGCLLFVLFCTHKNGWGFENFLKEVDTGEGMKFPAFIRGYMTYVLPLLILVIYFKGYYDTFKEKGTATLVAWMVVACLLVAFIIHLSLSVKKKKDA